MSSDRECSGGCPSCVNLARGVFRNRIEELEAISYCWIKDGASVDGAVMRTNPGSRLSPAVGEHYQKPCDRYQEKSGLG